MSKKILLADDSVTIRKVVELTFMEEDYELEAAADGREAVSSLESRAPDLVIADIHMPEVGGLDVARESKRRYPEVPVLLLVGTFEAFDQDDVAACGAEDFLKKPFDSQDLLKKVGNLLQRSQAAAGAATDAAPTEDAPSEQDEAAPAAEHGGEARADRDRPSSGALSDEDVERIARRVAEILTSEVVRDVAWEVVPDTAEIVIRERLRELESQVE